MGIKVRWLLVPSSAPLEAHCAACMHLIAAGLRSAELSEATDRVWNVYVMNDSARWENTHFTLGARYELLLLARVDISYERTFVGVLNQILVLPSL